MDRTTIPEIPSIKAAERQARQLTYYRIAGGAAVFALSCASWALSPHYPWVVAPINLVCLWIGKTLGIPIEAVTQSALAAMQSERVADIAIRALGSKPPAQQATAAQRIISSIRPDAASDPGLRFEE